MALIQSTGQIVNDGLVIAGQCLYDVNASHPLYVAYGTGTTAVSAGDTALENEVDRVLATATEETDYVAGYAIIYGQSLVLKASFDITSSITPTEVGVFDASSGGNMLYRAVISSGDRRNLSSGDVWEVEVIIKVEQGT